MFAIDWIHNKCRVESEIEKFHAEWCFVSLPLADVHLLVFSAALFQHHRAPLHCFRPPNHLLSHSQIIKAVSLDSEKLQRRDGEDGCRQFWSAYQQLQTGLLDVATAHATFAMKLHAHVMEPLKECGEQSEQVRTRITSSNGDLFTLKCVRVCVCKCENACRECVY